VLLVLAEEAPESRAEPRRQTGAHAGVDIALVVP
jgi:hypothetical protein